MKPLLLGVSVALLALGCGKPDSDAGGLPGSKGAGSAAPQSTGSVTLTGAGATFPNPLYSKWISEYGKAHADIKIDYQPIGSGGGIRQITERTVDFGASDAPMADEQLAKAAGIVHIPTCLGAVVLTYNLEGVPSGLKVSPEAAAGIFRQDQELGRSRPEEGQPRREAAAEAHRHGAPLRRQRHDAHLRRLPERREPRLEERPRERQ